MPLCVLLSGDAGDRAGVGEEFVKIESGTQVASRGPTWRTATPLV
jgi:hypothetical protein